LIRLLKKKKNTILKLTRVLLNAEFIKKRTGVDYKIDHPQSATFLTDRIEFVFNDYGRGYSLLLPTGVHEDAIVKERWLSSDLSRKEMIEKINKAVESDTIKKENDLELGLNENNVNDTSNEDQSIILDKIKNHPVMKEILDDSFGGVMYNVDNAGKYDAKELIELWNKLDDSVKESAGGLIKGAIDFTRDNEKVRGNKNNELRGKNNEKENKITSDFGEKEVDTSKIGNINELGDSQNKKDFQTRSNEISNVGNQKDTKQKVLDTLKPFVSASQLSVISSIDELSKIAKDLSQIIKTMPKSYETDGKSEDEILVKLHYFNGNSDWYITEKDSLDDQLQAFGYCILNGDINNAELGYININELKQLNVEIDLYWKEKSLSQVKNKQNDLNSTKNNENIIIDQNVDLDLRRGDKTRFYDNLSAIEVIKKLDNNEDISAEDKVILSKYVGWGGLSQAFYRADGSVTKGWEKEAKALKDALGEDYESVRDTVLDSFYTDGMITKAIWDGVGKFGFKQGSILEPSVGIGNFLRTMPADFKPSVEILGVEKDELTAKIAKVLYPHDTVYNIGFEELAVNKDSVSLVVGNPPYGQHKINDKINPELDGMLIHNYFMCKSIDLLETNGVCAMVVSNNFLDSKDVNTRAYIAKKANLIGAIRLPNNAFSKNANTEVTTDIVFFQKKDKYSLLDNSNDWLYLDELNDTPINQYFLEHPENLLGEWGRFGTMYQGGMPALIANPNQDTAKLLEDAIKGLPSYINSNAYEYYYSSHEDTSSKKIMSGVGINNSLVDSLSSQHNNKTTTDANINTFFINKDLIYRRLPNVNGEIVVKEINQKRLSDGSYKDLTIREIEKIKAMVKIAETATLLKDEQLKANVTEDDLKDLRDNLNNIYDNFVKKYGYLNNASNKRLFEEDNRLYFILALEKNYEKAVSKAMALRTGDISKPESAKKADIFYERTQYPHIVPKSADSYEDALSLCMSENTYVDIPFICSLLNKSEDDVIKYLTENELIYEDYSSSTGWSTKELYLSGNVKEKYKQTSNPINQRALKSVFPKDIEPLDIYVPIGATWISEKYMKDFITHLTGDNNPNVDYISYNAQWNINAETNVSCEEEYKTNRRNSLTIISATVNNKALLVYDTIEDENGKTRVLNEEETMAVSEKQEIVKAAWDNWIWSDKGRRDNLAKLYNEKFNVFAKTKFDGSHLPFFGKVNDDVISLRFHQKNVAWRTLQTGKVLLDHTVGTGKTFSAIATIMEMKRIGQACKPLICVPNHLVGDWAVAFYQLYPNANILVPSPKDFTAVNRKILMSRIATGNYDSVIISHEQLIKLENDKEFEIKFIKEQINEIQKGIDKIRRADGRDGRTVKQFITTQKNLKVKLSKLNDTKKDDNLTFLELGIDALVVDEAHMFKNLQFSTSMRNIAGLGNPLGSKRAFDLFIKTQSLLEKTGDKNLIFLTGTPISNSIAEMFTIQRYMDYQGLKRMGITHFDSWSRLFAENSANWELTPTGQYKIKTRLAKFKNLPELMSCYRQFADIVTREDVNKQLKEQGKKVPVPKIKGGKPENIVLDRSEDQSTFFGVEDKDGNYPKDSLVYRSENLSGKPQKGEDNMLVIMSDARKASLDMRIIDRDCDDYENSKTNVMIKNALKLYQKFDDDLGTQLIFCDLSTPKHAVSKQKAEIEELMRLADEGDEKAIEKLNQISPMEIDAIFQKFSVYDDIKEKLIKNGIPEKEIAFIHDYNTNKQKQDLFAKVNSGSIRFLLGSTSKMGAGMNVQKRLVTLHHLDVPWRPSDLEQREGRIIRQGNDLYEKYGDDFEINIWRYATKNTLDSRMWEIISTKAAFIEQIKRGDSNLREIEDVSTESMNSAEMKALASGNPLILEEMELRQKIKKLEAVKKDFLRTSFDRESTVKDLEKTIANYPKIKQDYLDDLNKYEKYQDDLFYKRNEYEKSKKENPKIKLKKPTGFYIELDGKTYDNRSDAGSFILKKARELIFENVNATKVVGNFAGFDIELSRKSTYYDKANLINITLCGNDDYTFDINVLEQKDFGIISKLIHKLESINNLISYLEHEYKSAKADLPILKEKNSSFEKEDELQLAKQRLKSVLAQLQSTKKNKKNADTVANNNNEKKNYKVSTWIDKNPEKNVKDIIGNVDYSILKSLDNNYIFIGNNFIIEETLDRNDYLKINKILSKLGGVWDKNLQATVFSDDGEKRLKELFELENINQVSNVNNNVDRFVS